MPDKEFVDLYYAINVWPSPWPLVLFPWPSGAVFQVQCGGLFCDQRQLEGIYLPVYGHYDLSFPSRLVELHPGCWEYRHQLSLTLQEADELDALFSEFAAPLKVIRTRLHESCEAWAHVEITPNQDRVLSHFSGYKGVLIWPNCD